MGFVNEKVSEEDKVKSGIMDLVKEYYRKDNIKFINLSDRYIMWTINKEKKIWFSYMISYHLDDHREGWTGEDIYILHYNGQNIEIDLRRIRDDETSLKLKDNPFVIKWKLEKVNNMDELIDISYEKIVEILNEVLKVFGTRGVDNIPQENLQVTLEA